MTRHGRIEGIIDHAFAARRLAIAADEEFLLALTDMLLFEAGRVLAAASEEQDASPEPERVRLRASRARPGCAVPLAPKRRRPGAR